MLEIVAAHDVKLGMYVAELDRPWVGTPFALQGFLVSNERQIAALREYCCFVSVDRDRSTYTDFTGSLMPTSSATPQQAWSVFEAFRAVAAIERPSGTVFGLGRPSMVSVNRVAAAPRRAPAAPQSAAQPGTSATPRHACIAPALGRMERVPAKKAAPNLQPPRIAFADLEGVVAGSGQRLSRTSRQTTYIDQSSVEAEMLFSGEAFQRAQELMVDVSDELAKDKLPQSERIREAVDGMVESVVRNPDALIWLSKLKRSDNYSYDHALDVSIHLMAFGRHLGFPAEELTILGVAGLLQDVGKVKVPLGLLQKGEALTPAERAVLRRHVDFSLQILAAQPGLPPRVLEIVARHHERHDGTGYPGRLAGKDIGLLAEMAGLVDTYCAMSYDRPYRRGLDNQNVLHKLYTSRSKRFAEPLVIEFIQCIGLYPVGTLVELRSGEVGVVVEQNRVRRLKPRIMLLLDYDKNPLPSPSELNLKDDPHTADGEVYQVRCALPPGAYGIEPTEFYL